MRAGFKYFIFLFIVVSCDKEINSENLPELTQNGEHTLGFLANNSAWLPFDRGHNKDNELPQPSITKNGGLVISATRIDEENHCRNWFCIEVIDDVFRPGKHKLSNRTCQAPFQTYYYGENKHLESEIYMMDTTSEHSMEFSKIDTVNMIISGTFQFNAISSSHDTLIVKDGRFDLKLKK